MELILLRLSFTGIEPVHPPKDLVRVRKLTVEMSSTRNWGANKRPLLAEQALNPFRTEGIYLWTGSHRFAAAINARLNEIPCLLMRASELNRKFLSAGYEPYWKTHPQSSWRCSIRSSNGGVPHDADYRDALTKIGFDEAAKMMQDEIDANEQNF